MSVASSTVQLPIPISHIANRYLLYSAPAITYLRHAYNILGVLIGSLPQAPQQNVFLGLPLELMPEEARLLVEMDVAYLVDDAAAHKRAFLSVEGGLSAEERRAFQLALRRQGVGAAKEAERRGLERKRAGLKKKGLDVQDWNDVPEDMLRPAGGRGEAKKQQPIVNTEQVEEAVEESLFASSTSSTRTTSSPSANIPDPEPYAITPTTSYPPLHPPPAPSLDNPPTALPSVPPAGYALYTHLHAQGYFLSPGLRFGCNYMAYPGDPLRFHSHFLCKGFEWEEEFDMLELVGGGRLANRNKKGFLVGGRVEGDEKGDWDGGGDKQRDDDGEKETVRCFVIEWAAM